MTEYCDYVLSRSHCTEIIWTSDWLLCDWWLTCVKPHAAAALERRKPFTCGSGARPQLSQTIPLPATPHCLLLSGLSDRSFLHMENVAANEKRQLLFGIQLRIRVLMCFWLLLLVMTTIGISLWPNYWCDFQHIQSRNGLEEAIKAVTAVLEGDSSC